jgi:flagellar protein FliS
MSYGTPHNAMNAYQQVGVQGSVEDATPHRLVELLFDGVLQRIAEAKHAIAEGDVAIKGERIGKAVSIVSGLRATLDHEAGGSIAENLDLLYDYMERRLTEANLSSDPVMLDEVARLMHEVKSAWGSIAPEAAAAAG